MHLQRGHFYLREHLTVNFLELNLRRECAPYLSEQQQRSAGPGVCVVVSQLEEFGRQNRRSKQTQEEKAADGQVLHTPTRHRGVNRMVRHDSIRYRFSYRAIRYLLIPQKMIRYNSIRYRSISIDISILSYYRPILNNHLHFINSQMQPKYIK